jgi:hypothetical protein
MDRRTTDLIGAHRSQVDPFLLRAEPWHCGGERQWIRAIKWCTHMVALSSMEWAPRRSSSSQIALRPASYRCPTAQPKPPTALRQGATIRLASAIARPRLQAKPRTLCRLLGTSRRSIALKAGGRVLRIRAPGVPLNDKRRTTLDYITRIDFVGGAP